MGFVAARDLAMLAIPSVAVIGIDVGQRVDPTAVVACELVEDRFLVQHLERLPLGTSYPDVAHRVRAIVQGVVRHLASLPGKAVLTPVERMATARREVWILADATGVGVPAIELIRERSEVKNITGVFFTSGDQCSVRPRAKEGSVGKAYLVSRLQALIQSRRILLPETDEARALAEELVNYEIRVSDNANMTAGAFRVGTHDDLVTALGLACLLDRERFVVRKMSTMPRAGW